MSNWTIPFVVRLDQGAPFIQQTAQGLMLPGDHEAHTIKTTVLDREEPAALSGTPMGYFRRKDGVTVKCAGTLDGNVLSVTMDDTCYLPGPLRCVIRLLTDVENDLGMSLVEAQFFVSEGTGDAIIDPDDVIPSVRVQAEQIAALRQSTGALDARVDDLENAPALVQELELNSTYWAKHPGLSDVTPRVVRKGGVVFMEGVLTNVQALTFGASSVYPVAALPSWAYPANSFVFVEQAANTAIFNLAAYASNGAYELQISHHMVGGSNTDAGANSVWRLNCCWLAADASGETVDDLETLIARMEAINSNAVRYDVAQVLTDAQKAQARTNVAAAGAVEVANLERAISPDYNPPYTYGEYAYIDGALRQAAQDIPATETTFMPGHWAVATMVDEFAHRVPYNKPIALSATEMLTATNNIGAVRAAWGQTLTEDQKQAVRYAIGLDLYDWNVNLTDAQKVQFRKNIDAAETPPITPEMYGAKGDGVTNDVQAIQYAFNEASASGRPVTFRAGAVYAVGGTYPWIAKRIQLYGNGATLKALDDCRPSEDNASCVLNIFSEEGQAPNLPGMGLIENLTIDCAGKANIGLLVGRAQGFQIHGLDIRTPKVCGLQVDGGYEIFVNSVRVAGADVYHSGSHAPGWRAIYYDPNNAAGVGTLYENTSGDWTEANISDSSVWTALGQINSAATVGVKVYNNDSHYTDIVTKNMGIGVQIGHPEGWGGGADIFTRVHSWNTDPAIIPTSVMFDIRNAGNSTILTDCFCDTCAVAVKLHAAVAVEIIGMYVLHGGSGTGGHMTPAIMGNVVPVVFDLPSLAAAANIRSFGMNYLSPTETYRMFSIDPGNTVFVFDWKTNNGVSVQNMNYFPKCVSIPAPPTTNGTYNLRVTVSGGAPTFSWVSI